MFRRRAKDQYNHYIFRFCKNFSLKVISDAVLLLSVFRFRQLPAYGIAPSSLSTFIIKLITFITKLITVLYRTFS